MRQFDYTKKWKKMLTPEIVRYLTTIHEYKGEQRLIAEHHADVLESLVEVAKIQSTESSNKIEGIYTSDECLKKIQDNIEKLLTIAIENNSMIYQERDGINTLLHFYEVQEFHSADKRLSDSEPHDVMSRSNDNYKGIVHQRSVDKGADSLQDEQSD